MIDCGSLVLSYLYGVDLKIPLFSFQRVIELSRKYLPDMAKGYDDPRVQINVGDGLEYMKEHENEFDVIITDSSDPIG